MSRAFLVHNKESVEIPHGESFVGRAVDCLLRFNDEALSRYHLRLVSSVAGVSIESLSCTNATFLNGGDLSSTRRLCNGDSIQLGDRLVSVVIGSSSDETPLGLTGFEDDAYGSSALFGELQIPASRNCPKCRVIVPNERDTCPTCAYQWPRGGHSMMTQEYVVPEQYRRSALRRLMRVPVIYSSECLALETSARDISEGGMFIASEILDPVSTTCEITALPDGRAALLFIAVVTHVSTEIRNGRPPGFGVTFTKVDCAGKQWLGSLAT